MQNKDNEPRRLLGRLAVGAVLTAFFFWLFGHDDKQEPAKPQAEKHESEKHRTESGAGMFRRARIVRERLAAGRETRDLNPVGIAAFGCLFLISMAVILVVTTGIFSLLSGKSPLPQIPPASLANAPGPTPPAGVQLEALPAVNYQQFLAGEEATLSSYGWIDKTRGIVHIPINRAMDLVVSQNLPARPASEAQKFKDNGNEIPSASSSGRVMERLYK